jgi:thiol-disulfide isomerase/thioredoxin
MINNKKNKQLTLLRIVKEELKRQPPYKPFVTDFIKNENDSDYIEYVKNLVYNNSLMASGGNNNVLLNAVNKKFSFDSLMHSLKGNVLYIDVWANWCNPCRAEMPQSAILREKYHDQKIKFIYLSIDDNIESWKNANKELLLDQYPNSSLLLNAQKTTFIKNFKIGSIPRYIIMNKNGVVSDPDSQRPRDSLITKVLEELIAK